MNTAREAAYRLDPVLWVREVLGMTPTAWQESFLRAQRGASILVLTARQVGKTTAAAWAMAHAALFMPGSLSVVACPTQRQSAEAVRKVHGMLLRCGAKLTSDNVYGLELTNGSRVLALPGSDDSVRGLTVDAWIVADEAARACHQISSRLYVPCEHAVLLRGWPCYRQPGPGRIRSGRLGKMAVRLGYA